MTIIHPEDPKVAELRSAFTRYKKPFEYVAAVVVVLIVSAFVVATNYHVDQVIIEPGTAPSVVNSITIDRAQTYKSSGDIRFLTVYVSADRPTLAKYLHAKYISKNAEIIPWKQVNGNLTPTQSDEINTALMKQSQSAASYAALEYLGCDIPLEGTGGVVLSVEKNSGASKAKLKPGDVITNIDGTQIKLHTDVIAAIEGHKAGDKIRVTYERGAQNEAHEITAVLGRHPDKKNTAFLGVGLATRDLTFELPISISYDPGDVSGPSAGLAFTLSIIDQLTPGDLTGNHDVSVTGEITLDGEVNGVGGVPQKAVAAKKAGSTLMIVPKGERKDARKTSGKMKVFEVSNIAQAVDVLEANGGEDISQMRSCPHS